jgi:hypothetical protein
MLRLVLGGLLLGSLFMAAPARALCDSPEDLAAVANTRALVEQRCNCEGAITHGQYVKCVAQVANEEMSALRLPRECRKVVIKCGARSTCGRPAGFYPCCKTNRLGKVKCKVRLPEQCRSGPGGSHCVSFTKKSCCDACLGVGTCASPSGAFVDPADGAS